MDINSIKIALARLREAADNACMSQNQDTLKEFWKAYYAVKKEDASYLDDCLRQVKQLEKR